MAKPWDRRMKGLFTEAPHDFVEWLVPGAQYVKIISSELEDETTFTDILCEILLAGERMLLHIEFQKRRDGRMAEHLWAYNQKATLKHHCAVWSVVIYLVEDRPIGEAPLTQHLPNGRPVHWFDFDIICLWKMTPEELKQKQRLGLLPLLPLTQDAARREVVEEVITELMPAGAEPKGELLTLTYELASLVFENQQQEADLQWLVRRFTSMYDILRETRAYKELTKEGREEGLEMGRLEGLEMGRREKLQELRQTVVDVVKERFPKLVRLAKKQVVFVEDSEVLRQLIVKVSSAQTQEEAKQHLLAVDEDEEEDE